MTDESDKYYCGDCNREMGDDFWHTIEGTKGDAVNFVCGDCFEKGLEADKYTVCPICATAYETKEGSCTTPNEHN